MDEEEEMIRQAIEMSQREEEERKKKDDAEENLQSQLANASATEADAIRKKMALD